MRSRILAAALLAGTMLASPAMAQSASVGTLDLRVGKLEKEMRAVQRSVFPTGVPVQPEIGAAAVPVTAAGNPATTPVADLVARVDSLEKGLATLTGQVEQNGYRDRQQDEAIKRIEARLTALEKFATPPEPGIAASTAKPPVAKLSVVKTSAVPRPIAAAPEKPAVTNADPARKTAVAAIEIPSTGDAEEDAYTYGYRLYAAKFYPEAEAKLKEFTAKYPSHRRSSYAQNLLGRAYFDEGKPALASVAFYDNYQKMPKGERAAESLTWLGSALIKLKKLPDACKVYDELQDVYGATLNGELKARAAKGRADAKCAA